MAAIQDPVWLQSKNLSADARGSIHDDERARSLGFKAALIGGSVHSAFVTKAVVERFGPAWYERGFMKQSYIHPLYEDDQFRIVTKELEPTGTDETLIELAFETRKGVRTTAGYAGLAKSAETAVPPWERAGRGPAADAPAPGTTPEAVFTRTFTIDESASRRELVGDDSLWYTDASPWGGPIVPSFMYMLIGTGGRVRQANGGDVPQAGMNSVWELLQAGPMFAGVPHQVTSRLIESGASARSGFRTTEFNVVDPAGRQTAVARQKIRWLLKQ